MLLCNEVLATLKSFKFRLFVGCVSKKWFLISCLLGMNAFVTLNSMINHRYSIDLFWLLLHGPLTRYVKLRVAHAPGMPGTFSPPPISKETAIKRSRHASRHVRDARTVMHAGIGSPRWRGKTFSAFLAHAQHAILRIWQEAHCAVIQCF